MTVIEIDTKHNRASYHLDNKSDATVHHQFSRRWEALVLAMLVQNAHIQRSLHSTILHQALHQAGQLGPLRREQVQRLLKSLEDFFHSIPNSGGLCIQTPPRKTTVGPWQLMWPSHISFKIIGEQSHVWLHPMITVGSSDLNALYAFLLGLLRADGCAVEGKFAAAIDVLTQQSQDGLSVEAIGMMNLRLCTWHRNVGHFSQAQALAERVLSTPHGEDPGLHAYAQFMLHRIRYDQNPAGHWADLWSKTSSPNGVNTQRQTDWRTQIEWHNLRALLARRHLQALMAKKAGQCKASRVSDGTLINAHHLAMQHFQAAMYMALWFKDWTRLEAFVANTTLYLQTAMGELSLCVTADQVLVWHGLLMKYSLKLNTETNSYWSHIFLAEFWLDHCANSASLLTNTLEHHLFDLRPDQEVFYQETIALVQACADSRQVAIARTLYLRFAGQHLKGAPQSVALKEQTKHLKALLDAQPNNDLFNALKEEGYTEHWPYELHKRTTQN